MSRHARLVLRALGVTLVAPAELPPASLLVANHISWLDAVAVLAVRPATFLAKQEVAEWPLIGRVTRRVGTRYLRRRELRALPGLVGELTGELRGGRTVALFPGGTTWCRPPGGRFRSGLFQAALDAGAPVRPVSISFEQGGRPSTVAAFVGDDSLIRSLWQVLRARDLAVRIVVHDALPTDPAEPSRVARRRLADAAHRTISAASRHVGAGTHLQVMLDAEQTPDTSAYR